MKDNRQRNAMAETNVSIRALFSIEEKEENGNVCFHVNYYCDVASSFFFTDILEPLFDIEIQKHQVVLKKASNIKDIPDWNRINLVVHTPKDLLTGFANGSGNINQFTQDLLLSPSNNSPQKKYPIIHFSLIDFFRDSLLGKTIAPKSLPRSYPIMDSSIWNYLVFIDNNIRLFKINLLRAIKSICHNYEKGLYSLEISYEYADLNARLLNESYLTGTHAKGVSPFIFHSERRILHSEHLTLWARKYKRNLKWRFLLLDDKVENDNDQTGEYYLTQWNGNRSNKTKTDIILDRLTELGFNSIAVSLPSECTDYDIELVYVDTVEGAKKLMKEYQFDIILLDYLLKNDYGYRLLHEVINDCQITGPHGELFFMFISAFTTAVSERLTFEGLPRNKRERWQIGEGACPTNTPELFKFRLLQLMESRLKQTCIHDLTYENIINDVKAIFKPDPIERGERIESVRNRAYKAYKTILGYHYDFFMLKMDEGKSLLVDSFMSNKVHMDALLEHLLQFVHLTAFGTVRQWPDIWEEYQYFIRSLGSSVSDDEIREVSNYIEQHIIDLKSN